MRALKSRDRQGAVPAMRFAWAGPFLIGRLPLGKTAALTGSIRKPTSVAVLECATAARDFLHSCLRKHRLNRRPATTANGEAKADQRGGGKRGPLSALPR